MTTKIATLPPKETVRSLLARPAYAQRFREVLDKRAPAFMSALVALADDPKLAKCEPRSVIAAAFVAATLDLPIQRSLGFAYVVPYAGVAQFQVGWKGYVQLALRSGKYRRMAAYPVNAEALKGMDEFCEPIIEAAALDDTKPAIGYVVAWELTNGFRKTCYWSTERIDAHSRRYSQAVKARKMDSPWFTHPDAMRLKTVVSNELRKWGVLSVEMQQALVADQSSREDIDAEPIYVDGATGSDTAEHGTLNLNALQPGDVTQHQGPDTPMGHMTEPKPKMQATPNPPMPKSKGQKNKQPSLPHEPVLLPGTCSLCGHDYKAGHYDEAGNPRPCVIDKCGCGIAIENAQNA